jgi:SAM-dependent methyltransferase
MAWLALALGLVLIAAVLYWQFVIAEGAYLGRRIVVLLYDWSARSYERIKQYDTGDEQWFLGIPLTEGLQWLPHPLVLDVATGTGRLPRALFRQPGFDGRVIGLDLSRRMLHEAISATAQFSDRLTLIWQDAEDLPFRDDTFDAVTCLEALEFMPHPAAVLAEMVRVLRPGGILVTTNRVGRQARLLPGRTFSRQQLEHLLKSMPLEGIRIRAWQVDYDLVWARKTGTPRGSGMRPLPYILRCPRCHGPVVWADNALECPTCDTHYPRAADGVIEMAHPQARPPANRRM